MRKKQMHLYSIIGVLLVAAIAGAMIMNGNTIYNAENIVTIAAQDATGTAVTISSWSGKTTELSVTPAGDVAYLSLTFDHKYKDLTGQANALDIDFKGIQKVAGTTADTAKIWLTDGTNTVLLGVVDLEKGSAVLMLDSDDLKVLDDFASVQLQIKFYDSSSGNLTTYMAANAESTIVLAFKVMIDTSSVGAFFASTGMAVMAGVRKLSAGISGVAASAAAAFFTNSAIITIGIGLAVLFGALYLTGGTKKIKRYF